MRFIRFRALGEKKKNFPGFSVDIQHSIVSGIENKCLMNLYPSKCFLKSQHSPPAHFNCSLLHEQQYLCSITLSHAYIRQLHVNSSRCFKNNPCVQTASASFFSSLLSPCYYLTVHLFAKDLSFLSKYIKWFLLYYQYFFLSILGTTEGLTSYLKIQNLRQYWNSKHLVLV